MLKQDPFLRRVNEKPRGYAGDAVMIDLIYRTGDCPQIVGSATPFGQLVYATTSASAASDAVRERRSILAERIDLTADRVNRPSILAVAAGHLREAGLSRAFAEGRIGRWIALDQDPASIAEIESSLGGRIETVPEAINVILKGDYSLSDIDYAYAAGLYDYLPSGIAIRLTRKMGAMLRPGGRLLFANFADDIWDAGFMEAVMGWKLILRSRDDMRKISTAMGDGFAAEHWTGSNGAIHYCELTRK
jgi:SAM-dependent methyltransferase